MSEGKTILRDVWTVSDDSLAFSFFLLKVASILNHGRLALLFLKNTESVGSTEKARPLSGAVIDKGLWSPRTKF